MRQRASKEKSAFIIFIGPTEFGNEYHLAARKTTAPRTPYGQDSRKRSLELAENHIGSDFAIPSRPLKSTWSSQDKKSQNLRVHSKTGSFRREACLIGPGAFLSRARRGNSHFRGWQSAGDSFHGHSTRASTHAVCTKDHDSIQPQTSKSYNLKRRTKETVTADSLASAISLEQKPCKSRTANLTATTPKLHK